MTSELKPTGERVIEDAYRRTLGGYVIYLMHMASYQFARKYCTGKRVLDLGCGSGYGAASLADIAESIMAVDISSEAILFASERYKTPNISFREIDSTKPLPFSDEEFDVVLSFQVIEHITDHSAYLREAKRVLKSDGMMIIVTPDRSLRLLPFQKPWNRWHVREYSATALHRAVAPWFEIDSLLHMGAADEIAKVETQRYRFAKWALLPVTLPFVPEPIRQGTLAMIQKLRDTRTRIPTGETVEPMTFEFDVSAMKIAAKVPNPLNLVLLARKTIANDR